MPMFVDGETKHKVVVLGTRGAATRLLELRPREWNAEQWRRADGQGGPGEPRMDWASFHTAFQLGDANHRAYFFGHGIASHDLDRLGPETTSAIMKRADHLIVVLDDADAEIGEVALDVAGESAPAVTVVTFGASPGAIAHPVVALTEDTAAAWMRDFVLWLAAPRPEISADAISTIVSLNLARSHFATLVPPWEISFSPIWEPGPNGTAVRRAFLAPRSMRAHYFEGPALDLLHDPQLPAVITAMAREPDARHPLRELRSLYCDPDAPFVEVAPVWSQDIALLSLHLADAARRARVGVTVPQLLAREIRPDQSDALHAIESDFMDAMAEAPVEALLQATRDLARGR